MKQTANDEPMAPTGARQAMEDARLNTGESVAEASRRQPLLLVFLRHLGCTFCREALADISRQRSEIEGQGVRIVLAHMAPDEDAAALFDKYGLADVARVSDPNKRLYKAVGLERGSIKQLFGPKVWLRGFSATFSGAIVGRPVGDPWQMPGALVVHDGEVVQAFRHQTAADRPDYRGLACAAEGCGVADGERD